MNRVLFIQRKLPADERKVSELAIRWHRYNSVVLNKGSVHGINLFTFLPISHKVEEILCEQGILELVIHPKSHHFIIRLSSLVESIRNTPSAFTLVCGDTHVSFLLALFIKYFARQKIKIQIQIHGNIYSLRGHKKFMELFKSIATRVAIKLADSVRIVSEFQRNDLLAISKNSHGKIILAPIPIDPSKLVERKLPKEIDLAIVGRLHRERGTTQLLELISMIKKIRKNTIFVIAGDGPEKEFLEKSLCEWLADGTVRFTGYLERSQVGETLAASKILLSTAPSEGYGLTIREAILNGAVVVAKKSKGTLEASKHFPDLIYLFESNIDAAEISISLLNKYRYADTAALIELQKKHDSQSINALVTSWF